MNGVDAVTACKASCPKFCYSCFDIGGWIDLDGDPCSTYAANGWCGNAGLWAYAVNGVDATQACKSSCADWFCMMNHPEASKAWCEAAGAAPARGWDADGEYCRAASCQIDGCIECLNNGSCRICADGLHLHGGECVEQCTVEGCSACTASGTCTDCAAGRYDPFSSYGNEYAGYTQSWTPNPGSLCIEVAPCVVDGCLECWYDGTCKTCAAGSYYHVEKAYVDGVLQFTRSECIAITDFPATFLDGSVRSVGGLLHGLGPSSH